MKPTAVCIGTLHDDLITLAAKIQNALFDGYLSVWAADDGSVFMADPDKAEAVPLHWIAGTFAMGQPLHEIAEDLQALLRERSKDWIIEK